MVSVKEGQLQLQHGYGNAVALTVAAKVKNFSAKIFNCHNFEKLPKTVWPQEVLLLQRSVVMSYLSVWNTDHNLATFGRNFAYYLKVTYSRCRLPHLCSAFFASTSTRPVRFSVTNVVRS